MTDGNPDEWRGLRDLFITITGETTVKTDKREGPRRGFPSERDADMGGFSGNALETAIADGLEDAIDTSGGETSGSGSYD